MKSKLGIASILFLLATIFLKISGLLRDMIIAFYFGDSYMSDAYLAAFIIPNMIILFFTTGMKNAFVPSYIHSIEQKREKHHMSEVLKGSIIISIVLSVLGVSLARFYIPLLYPEFNAQGQEIAIWVSIILFISVLFVGINSVLEAFFDSENKFSLSVISQIIVVTSTITGALLFADKIGPYSLAIGYLSGTILSLTFKLIIVIPRKLIKLNGKIDWLEIKSFYVIFIPVALTVAIGQINLAVDNVFASYFEEGVVTYVNYAKNLVHFPQAIFGVVIGTVIFPFLSRATAQQDRAIFKLGIERGLTTMYLILLPSIAGMMILMPNIIELLYERGAFGHDATMVTARVAYYYAGSVLFFSLHNVITKGFYTLQKGHLILYIGGVSVILNIILNFVLTKLIGYNGIPLASSVTAFLYVVGTFIVFLKLVDGLKFKEIAREYFKITVSVILMVAIVIYVKQYIIGFSALIQIIIVGLIGSISYFLITLMLKINALQFLLKNTLGKRDSNRG